VDVDPLPGAKRLDAAISRTRRRRRPGARPDHLCTPTRLSSRWAGGDDRKPAV